MSKAGPSAVVALLLVLGDHAEAQRQIYGKRLLELDRYYHVTHFDLTYSPYTELEIKNLIEESEPLDISCDKDVLFLVGKKKQKTKSYRGLLYPQTNAQKIYMRFDDQNSKCTAKVMGYRIQINPEVDAHPSVAQLRSVTDRCQLNTPASSPLSLGCHLQTEDVEILANPYDALNARFKMLMGYELSYADYLKKDPRMPLDFSHTPQLDLVVFDTLQIMKDFVGTLHIRMLEHHLRQGAKVYITTSKALLLPHETGWLYELKRRYPEIHFRTYEKTPEKLNLKESFHSLHRNSHVKVLLTYSQEHPENNALIAGGRNASEMYFYAQQPDNSKYPEIIQWGSEPLYGWVYFNDLDFKVSGSSVTAALARSLMSYNEELPWNLSQEKIPAQNEEDTSNMSFFLSSPFAEGKGQLEDVYVDLFNNAQDSIHIYSPYINFTKNIAQALNEAQRRGVRIDITTNLSVEGDFMPGILQPAMNRSIREVVKKYRIQYFSANKQIYHTKAVVIDNTMIVLGSINMNQRSFIHDTEIAFLFKDPKVLTQFERVFSHGIRPYVQELTPEQIPRASLMELLVSPFMSVF
nr:hypothetical protein HAGR004_40870 [Bdellovibrio sp. HAGR004]